MANYTARILAANKAEDEEQGGWMHRLWLGLVFRPWFSLFNKEYRLAAKLIKQYDLTLNTLEAFEAAKADRKEHLERVVSSPKAPQATSDPFVWSGKLFPIWEKDFPQPDMKKVKRIIKLLKNSQPKSSLDKSMQALKDRDAFRSKNQAKTFTAEGIKDRGGSTTDAEIVSSSDYMNSGDRNSHGNNQNNHKKGNKGNNQNQNRRPGYTDCEDLH